MVHCEGVRVVADVAGRRACNGEGFEGCESWMEPEGFEVRCVVPGARAAERVRAFNRRTSPWLRWPCGHDCGRRGDGGTRIPSPGGRARERVA